MTTELKQILVFKTNIRTPTELRCFKGILDMHAAVYQWSIDQEDVDCVLRVVTPTLSSSDIIHLVCSNGFSCSELD